MIENEKESGAQPIYSKWAILGFCMFFSPLFGAVMLRQNLADIGQKRAGMFMVILGLWMSTLTGLVASTPYGGMGVTAVMNFGQGALMLEYAFRKYLPHAESLPKKRINKPLYISLLLTAVLMFLMVMAGAQLPAK